MICSYSSNDADWVRDLRIILIAAQKNYVLDAPMKNGKGKKGNFKKNGKQVATPMKKPKARCKPGTECFYCEGNGHWKRKFPEYLVDKKDGRVNKGIFDIQVIDVYLTSVYSSPSVFDTCLLLRLVTQNRNCTIKRD